MSYFRWTPEREAELIGRRQAGERMWQIALAMGTSYSSVANRSNRLLERGAVAPLENVKRGFVDARERFWALVDRDGGEGTCWPWRGRLRADGRGSVGFEVAGLRPDAKTHRVAYLLENGALPERPLVVRHTCDNGQCCNPAHLIPGTYKDNAQDCLERGRHPSQRRRAA